MIHTPNDPCECGMALWSERWVTEGAGPKLLSDWKRRLFCAGCDRPKATEATLRAPEAWDEYWTPEPMDHTDFPKPKKKRHDH